VSGLEYSLRCFRRIHAFCPEQESLQCHTYRQGVVFANGILGRQQEKSLQEHLQSQVSIVAASKPGRVKDFPFSVLSRPGNTSRGPNLTYRTPSAARYSVSFRRVVNLQDMKAIVRIQFELSKLVRMYTVN
jgi:hypothetical protein